MFVFIYWYGDFRNSYKTTKNEFNNRQPKMSFEQHAIERYRKMKMSNLHLYLHMYSCCDEHKRVKKDERKSKLISINTYFTQQTSIKIR